MAASIREAADAVYTAAASNFSRFTADVSDSQFSVLSTIMANKISLILGAVVIFAIMKMMSGPKLPKGVKPLPSHPGMMHPPPFLAAALTRSRPPMGWPVLGCARRRHRERMALRRASQEIRPDLRESK